MDPAYEMFGQFLYIANHFLLNFFLFKLSGDMLHNTEYFFYILKTNSTLISIGK